MSTSARIVIVGDVDLELAYLKQKAKINYIMYEEKNSKFMHSYIKENRLNQGIHQINYCSRSLTKTEDIGNSAVQYLKQLFTSKATWNGVLADGIIPNPVNELHNAMLIEPPTMEEVKVAVFSIHPDSSAGPDGFSSKFYQICWDIVASHTLEAITNFFMHDAWDLEEDSKALHFLQPDLVLFTGDFGNENVKLVRSISKLDFPKAAILGNHDCWGTYDFLQKKETLVHLQLESLGKQHVGYSRLDMPVLKLSVIGGRPFSSGGDRLFRPKLLSQRYGVHNLEDSKKKINKAALGAPNDHYLVFLAHNGPTGLGSKMDDICGRDWLYEGGDHGDTDLAQALLELRSKQIPIPLVVFGHMHKRLAHGGLRKMIVVGADGIIYLNGAVVPRVKCVGGRAGSSKTINDYPEPSNEGGGTMRAFTVVDIENGRVEKISETWVLVTTKRTALEMENILFKR